MIKAYASGGSGNKRGNPAPQSIPSRNRRGTPAVYNPPIRSSIVPTMQAYIARYGRGK